LDEATLRQATRDLAARLRVPARVTAVETAPRRLSLLLDWPEPGARRRLVIDVDPAHPTLHLAPAGREPAVASTGGFGGGLPGLFLVAVEEAGEPRLLRFCFVPPPRAEGAGSRTLVAEWTGASGNLRLLDEDGIVLEAAYPRGPRPGDAWRPPRRRDGPRLGGLTTDGVDTARTDKDSVPIITDADSPPVTAEPDSALRPVHPGATHGSAVPNGPRDPEAFHADLARTHVAAIARAEAEERRRLSLQSLRAETRRLLRLRDNLLRERVDPGFGARLRRSAEALLGHLHEVKKGDTRFECPDWVREGETLVVELDPAKTPARNAEDIFRCARRWDRGEPHRRRRLEGIDKTAARLSALEVKVRDADAPLGDIAFGRRLDEALGIFRRRPAAAVDHTAGAGGRGDARGTGDRGHARGTGRAHAEGKAGRAGSQAASRERSGRGEQTSARGGSSGAPIPAPAPASASGTETPRDRRERKDGTRFHPRSYQTKDGWTVLVGRSNQENDYLTHRMAHPEDYWFHAHGVSGSHVVLRREGRKDNPSAKTIEEAAAIAAFFSKARHSSKAPVIYTLKKYVRKPRGAKAGLAMCQREKSIMVLPKDPAEGREPEWMEE
jgi:predicted ribosome quality control (RQC) complex YloA/Tae2 family protein